MKLYSISIEKPEGAFTVTLHDGAISVEVSCNTRTSDPGFLRDIALAIHEAAERLDKLLGP